MFFSTRNERMGLLLATVLFAVIAIVQFYRAVMNLPVTVGSWAVPDWFSLLAGLIAGFMAVWMGALLRHRRPLL